MHVGHELEVGRLSIPEDQKVLLASQMNSGIPKSRILSDIRQSFSPANLLCITNPKNLHNICRDFKVDDGVILHETEYVSVGMHVQRLKEDGQVLIYKPKGQDYPTYHNLKKDDFLLGLMNSAQLKILELRIWE